MRKMTKIEAILWSVALPGFGQILRGQYFTGTLFIFLEFLINVNSHFNLAIMHSFLWEIDEAIAVIDYQWLMFYPCLYMFAMWDAYRYAMPNKEKLSFLPFVFGAYFVTVGLMYSTELKVFNILFGPVFLPMMFLPLGLMVGFLIRMVLIRNEKVHS
ncbi:hypothetical protein ACFSO7_04715 [Bacillus sp. CGMCC 1.16607]|uniref:hypothetical protein n=1 Tax=Bacillus sp. CGMCC 1.16607 TaxID=3351842 RepID=UPI00362AC59C